MIVVTKAVSTYYCNACLERAEFDVTFQKIGKPFSSSISLCKECLSGLADVAKEVSEKDGKNVD